MSINSEYISEQKNIIRSKIKIFRKNLSQIESEKYNQKILNNLISLDCYKKNSLILTYVSKNTEVDTIKFISTALSENKQVAVPYCLPNTNEMDFYIIDSFDSLKIGSFGIYEPIIKNCIRLDNFSDGICIIPAFSFDLNGYRIGHGKGYYDRFLTKFRGVTIGVCYDDNIVENLPHDKFDIPVQIVITEKYIRYITRLN